MKNYWTCSKLANWIRGTPKPKAGTSKEWREWERSARESHPFRYWLAEKGLDYLQDIWCYLPDKLNDIRYYLNNRFVARSHCLTADPRDIPRGQWRDVGNRFLPCLFNELVRYVEIEKAWMMVCWADNETRAKYKLPFWRKQWWTRWFMEWRCAEAGLAYLDWEIGLKHDEDWVDPTSPEYGQPTFQAINAKEIKELYLWWTQLRPRRADPYIESGWSELCESRIADGDVFSVLEEQSPADAAKTTASLDILRSLEEQYDQEDENMMIRLIKVRNSLWT